MSSNPLVWWLAIEGTVLMLLLAGAALAAASVVAFYAFIFIRNIFLLVALAVERLSER
jgi:hypothetical protein